MNTKKSIKKRIRDNYYAMVSRCHKPSDRSYHKYGARGIKVCDEWRNNINAFYAWALFSGYEYKPNEGGYNTISLDRIDNDKGYSPENCRWTTKQIQATNQRVRKVKDRIVKYTGIRVRKFEFKLSFTSRICVKGKDITIGSYDTLKEAVEARNSYIVKNKLPHKLQEYIEDNELYDKLLKETPKAKNTYKRLTTKSYIRRPVKAFNLDGKEVGQYDSIREASEALEVERSHISSVCKGKRKTTGGYTFKYI